MRPFYHRFAWAYDLLIPRPAGLSAEAVARLFRAYGVDAGSRVVDAGCGTGSFALALSAAGFEVTAIDRSAELLDHARAKAAGVALAPTFLEADLLTWSPAQRVEGVLCRGVLNDLLTDDERDRAMANFGRWLRPGGVLLADVRDWDASRSRYLDQPITEMQADLENGWLRFTSKTTVDEATQRLELDERFTGEIDGQPIDGPYEFAMRCWSLDEVRDRADRAGFSIVSPLEGEGHRADRIVFAAIR